MSVSVWSGLSPWCYIPPRECTQWASHSPRNQNSRGRDSRVNKVADDILRSCDVIREAIRNDIRLKLHATVKKERSIVSLCVLILSNFALLDKQLGVSIQWLHIVDTMPLKWLGGQLQIKSFIIAFVWSHGLMHNECSRTKTKMLALRVTLPLSFWPISLFSMSQVVSGYQHALLPSA